MRAPPVVHLAAALAAGAGLAGSGAPLFLAPLLGAVLLLAPAHASRRPIVRACGAALLAGGVLGSGPRPGAGCDLPPAGMEATVSGRFLASPRHGSAPLLRPGGCAPLTVVVAGDATGSVAAGVPVVLRGRVEAGRLRPWLRAGERGGVVRVAEGESGGEGGLARLRWAGVRWRDRLTGRAEHLYGARAPLVTALTLARREGLDPALSDAFAATGIAHLLAISGFHVGIMAGLAFVLLRLVGAGARAAAVGAAGLAWGYVLLIGAPSAACRAALILTAVAAARARGRPPARWGPLAAALAVLVVVDPTRLGSPGFQLSFSGAAGLTAWSAPLRETLLRATRGACPRSLAATLAASLAATAATLPIAAWHFERVSLVGVPMTLAATPLVTLALPAAVASLLLEPLPGPAAAFVAAGVDTLLALLEALTLRVAAEPSASAWTTRSAVAAAVAGWALAAHVSRQAWVGRGARVRLVSAYVCAALLAWPLLRGWSGTHDLTLLVLDVGQGDAVALRSPRGRWILVDAGPPPRSGGDPRGLAVARALRTRGVRRLEALVLTHADADHVGGAEQILRELYVGAVYDPAVAVGKAEYVALLEVAGARDVSWRPARAGLVLDFDGAVIEILSPGDSLARAGETNEASVVARVRYGVFDALLTGDAYKDVERRLAPGLAGLEVLKVGHHGSDTSTDSLLLARAGPSVALISVGRANRYGHPAPEVLERLRAAGVGVRRTDREGTLTVVARADGSFEVSAERGPRSRHRARR